MFDLRSRRIAGNRAPRLDDTIALALTGGELSSLRMQLQTLKHPPIARR